MNLLDSSTGCLGDRSDGVDCDRCRAGGAAAATGGGRPPNENVFIRSPGGGLGAVGGGGEGVSSIGGTGCPNARVAPAESRPRSGDTVGDILGFANENVWNRFFSSLTNDDEAELAGAELGGGMGDQAGLLCPKPAPSLDPTYTLWLSGWLDVSTASSSSASSSSSTIPPSPAEDEKPSTPGRGLVAIVIGGLLVDDPPNVADVAKLGERDEGVELDDEAEEETGELLPAAASDMSTDVGSRLPNEFRFAILEVEADWAVGKENGSGSDSMSAKGGLSELEREKHVSSFETSKSRHVGTHRPARQSRCRR